MGPVGGQLGRVELLSWVTASAGAGVWDWAVGCTGVLVAAAVARAAARATAYGIDRPLPGAASHLDLLGGVPSSLPSSWAAFLLAWAGVVLLLGLGGERSGVHGDADPGPLLPALLHCRDSGPAAAAACCSSATAATCCGSTAPPTVPFGVGPEKLFVSLFVVFRLVLLGSG